jgi:thymidylate kinase
MTEFENTDVIEFMGLPRTGKTTAVEAISDRLNEIGVNTSIIRERASVCPVRNKMSPLFNYWTAISQMKAYVEACDKGVEVLLADRGVLDSAVWLYFKNQTGSFDEEVRCFKPLLHNRFMNASTKLAVFFYCDIDLILAREEERRIRPKSATVVNRLVLQGYLQSYREAKRELESITEIVEIDTTALSIKELLDRVSEVVVSTVKATDSST